MASDNFTPRPQGVWRIELEMIIESGPMSQFARQLRLVVAERDGFAFLPAVE